MNLFGFDSQKRRLIAGKDLWIYIAICVPLTIFTFVSWKIYAAKHDRDEKKRHARELRAQIPMRSTEKI